MRFNTNRQIHLIYAYARTYQFICRFVLKRTAQYTATMQPSASALSCRSAQHRVASAVFYDQNVFSLADRRSHLHLLLVNFCRMIDAVTANLLHQVQSKTWIQWAIMKLCGQVALIAACHYSLIDHNLLQCDHAFLNYFDDCCFIISN